MLLLAGLVALPGCGSSGAPKASAAKASPKTTTEKTPPSTTAARTSRLSAVAVYSTEQYHPKTKSVALQFLMGGGSFFTGLTWRQWGSAQAAGSGTFEINTCQPDCATARPMSYRGLISLSGIKRCGSRHYYTRARTTYAIGGRRRSDTASMGQPYSPC